MSQVPSSFHSDQIPTFEDLPPSTRCIMAYSSVNFDLEKLYNLLPIYEVDAPLTKKQKHVDKKKVKAPYGAIVSVSTKRKIRGLDMRNKKKKTEQERTIDFFLNQVTVVLSIGKFMLNIMIFKNSFKIAGCKIEEDAIVATRILWEDYIYKTDAWTLAKGQKPRFAFEVVMFNVGFNLGFDIDRDALNVLMNSKQYEDKVSLSQYDSTIHTSVNIKLFSDKPEDLCYDCLCYPKLKSTKDPYLTSLANIPYKKLKNKKMYTTFIVFSSSETILTGRYVRNMRDAYQFFVNEAFKNKKKIEERVVKPKRAFVSL